MRRASKFSANNGSRQGAAAVEFALVLPFLLLILFGVWELGRLVQVTQIISNAAREGGRLSATGTLSASELTTTGTAYQIQRAVGNYIQNAGLPVPVNGISVKVSRFVSGDTSPVSVCTGTIRISSSNSTDVTVTLSGTAPSTDPVLGTDQYDTLFVEVNYPFNFARWMPLNPIFSLSENTQVYGSAKWPCMRDKPVAIDSTIPQSPLK
jgi:Flp pilus assembly protein TadG